MESVLAAASTRSSRDDLLSKEQVQRITELQKTAARRGYRERIALGDNITQEHKTVFVRALNNVLSTELALLTFAQIVDGLPIADVAFDRVDTWWPEDGHPVEEHEELCPGAMEKARELQKAWDVSTLKFNPKLVRAYRLASEGSKQFNTRLIELVTVAIHQLAVQVFKMELNLHQGDVDSAVNWVKPEPEDYLGEWYEMPPRPTLFNHVGFFENEIYPESEADMAGYWAEDRILGGVPVFDRKSEDDVTSLPNVYFHACHYRVTRRIFQLTDEQQNALTEFLLADTSMPPPEPSPLPILGGKKNYVRVDVHKAILHHRVYRDFWERKPWVADEVLKFERRPKEQIDYPGMPALADHINSLPLSSEQVEFSESGKPHDSFFEEVGLPTPWEKGENAEVGENTSGAPADRASKSACRKEPAPDHDPAVSERPQGTSGSVEEKEGDSSGPLGDKATGSAGEKDPAGEGGREEETVSVENGVDRAVLRGQDEALNEETAADTPGHQAKREPEAGSSDPTGEGEDRGGKRRRLS